MESVSKQLMHPSILDGSFRDNAQALVNRWNQAKNNANERMLKLDEKFENAKRLLDDVNMAIDWLSKSRIFDKIRSGKQKFQQEQDKDKKIDILQVKHWTVSKQGPYYMAHMFHIIWIIWSI